MACSSSDTKNIFEGVSTLSGIVGPWRQTLTPSSLARQCEGFTRCWFTFTVAGVLGPRHVPWPVINVDLNLRQDLTNFILMRCDTNSYTLATSCYSSLEWNTLGLKDYMGLGIAPDRAQTHRVPSALPRRAELKDTPTSFPSPMKGVEYHPQIDYRGEPSQMGQYNNCQKEGDRNCHPTPGQDQSQKRRRRNSRNRRHRAQNRGGSCGKDRNSHGIKKRQRRNPPPY